VLILTCGMDNVHRVPGGWYTELPHWDCSSSGSVRKGGGPKNGSAHSGDWKTADTATEWIREHVNASPEVPFLD
jgi:hypothetical protein